jgi:L-lysine exporter family protein LysE/ArgO
VSTSILSSYGILPAMQIILFSLLLGLGLAIPVGPVTIEMMRRNLRYGLWRGIAIGAGASSADVIYLLLVLWGILPFIKDSPFLLQTIGILGALLLIWFAYKTIRQTTKVEEENDNDSGLLHCYMSGFLIAFLSPFNILFWLSIAAQFAAIISKVSADYWLACIGLFIGTAIWFCGLNVFIHFTRHRLSPKIIKGLNMAGGIALVVFAIYSVGHVFNVI